MLGRTYDRLNCSAARALEVVGERWSLMILRNAMFAGATRFNYFQRKLGIAPNFLSARLDWFVEAGLMVGEFHPTSEVGGSTNPAFRPMRSPVPAIVIREMSVHDIRFLAVSSEPPERQIRYVNAYLKHMQGRATPELLAKARATLEQLGAVNPAE